MKRMAVRIIIFLQRWGIRLSLPPAAWRLLDRACILLAHWLDIPSRL